MKFPDWLPVYGDTKFRGECPNESAEQVMFFNKIRTLYPNTYGKVAQHIRNEGKKTPQQVARQKLEGMVTGSADIVIPAKQAFVCELKRKNHTKSSWQPSQIEYLESCQALGAFVCVALGYEAALQAFNDWRVLHEKNI